MRSLLMVAALLSGCQSYLVRPADYAQTGNNVVPAWRESNGSPVALDRQTIRRLGEQPADRSLVRVGALGTHSRAFRAGWITMVFGGVLATIGTALIIKSFDCKGNIFDAGSCPYGGMFFPGLVVAGIGDASWGAVGPIMMAVGAALPARELPIPSQVALRF